MINSGPSPSSVSPAKDDINQLKNKMFNMNSDPIMTSYDDTQYGDHQMDKFLQLDGTNDEVEKIIAASSDQKQQPQQSHTIQQQQPRSQVRSSPANVQSYLKLNSPVVLNHELLASYGVSLNGSQQNQSMMMNSSEKVNYQKGVVNSHIRRDDFSSQKIISGKNFEIIISVNY